MTSQLRLAQVAYAAYGESTGGKTFDGRPMPEWDDLGEGIQRAWREAAAAVAAELRETPPRLAQGGVVHASGGTWPPPLAPPVPSICRMVIARVNPADNNGSDLAPAIITRVWDKFNGVDSVNLTVFYDAGEPQSHGSVSLYPTLADCPEWQPNACLTAFWPPRS